MADQPAPSVPDLKRGFPQHDVADGGKLLGHVDGDDVLLVRRGREVFRSRRSLHALPRSARRWPRGRRHRALSLASRLLRSAHGRSLARPGLEPARVLVGRAARRQDLRAREARATDSRDHAADQQVQASGKIVIVGGGAAGFAAAGNAAARAISGQHRHAEQ